MPEVSSDRHHLGPMQADSLLGWPTSQASPRGLSGKVDSEPLGASADAAWTSAAAAAAARPGQTWRPQPIRASQQNRLPLPPRAAASVYQGPASDAAWHATMREPKPHASVVRATAAPEPEEASPVLLEAGRCQGHGQHEAAAAAANASAATALRPLIAQLQSGSLSHSGSRHQQVSAVQQTLSASSDPTKVHAAFSFADLPTCARARSIHELMYAERLLKQKHLSCHGRSSCLGIPDLEKLGRTILGSPAPQESICVDLTGGSPDQSTCEQVPASVAVSQIGPPAGTESSKSLPQQGTLSGQGHAEYVAEAEQKVESSPEKPLQSAAENAAERAVPYHHETSQVCPPAVNHQVSMQEDGAHPVDVGSDTTADLPNHQDEPEMSGGNHSAAEEAGASDSPPATQEHPVTLTALKAEEVSGGVDLSPAAPNEPSPLGSRDCQDMGGASPPQQGWAPAVGDQAQPMQMGVHSAAEVGHDNAAVAAADLNSDEPPEDDATEVDTLPVLPFRARGPAGQGVSDKQPAIPPSASVVALQTPTARSEASILLKQHRLPVASDTISRLSFVSESGAQQHELVWLLISQAWSKQHLSGLTVGPVCLLKLCLMYAGLQT